MKPIILDDRTIQLFEITLKNFPVSDRDVVFDYAFQSIKDERYHDMINWFLEFTPTFEAVSDLTDDPGLYRHAINIVFATPDDLIAWKLRWY